MTEELKEKLIELDEVLHTLNPEELLNYLYMNEYEMEQLRNLITYELSISDGKVTKLINSGYSDKKLVWVFWTLLNLYIRRN